MTRNEIVAALAVFRRPGHPMFERHFQGLPPAVVRKGNVQRLVSILSDGGLPATVRRNAAGALGETGDARAVKPLIEALRQPATRRCAAIALGRLKARPAAKPLRELMPEDAAAKWALSQLAPPRTVEEIIEDLRSGQIRRIGPKIDTLSEGQAKAVAADVQRRLRQAVVERTLSPEHRWLVTSLQYLAPPDAGDVLTEALRQSIHMTNCCGCTRNRAIRALGAIRPPQAIPALADVICQVDNAAHKQLAAVCIEKIVKARGQPAAALLRTSLASLRRELGRLGQGAASARPAAAKRAAQAIARIAAL